MAPKHDPWDGRCAFLARSLLINAVNADWLRAVLHERGVEAIIPARAKRLNPAPHDTEKYKWRPPVGNFFEKLKEFKKVAMRVWSIGQRSAAMMRLAATGIRTR